MGDSVHNMGDFTYMGDFVHNMGDFTYMGDFYITWGIITYYGGLLLHNLGEYYTMIYERLLIRMLTLYDDI